MIEWLRDLSIDKIESGKNWDIKRELISLSIQEKILSILKENAEEEVKIVEDKYSALEEADNNYLDALEDAIQKQRNLRDKQNKYEDLSTQEKKLSLLQRDTGSPPHGG